MSLQRKTVQHQRREAGSRAPNLELISEPRVHLSHEAGHAVAHVMLARPFKYVIIRSDADAAGHIGYRYPRRLIENLRRGDRDGPHTRIYLEDQCVTTLARPVAQRKRFPRSSLKDVSEGHLNSGSDRSIVVRICNDLFDDELIEFAYYRYPRERARALIRLHWKAMGRVASELMKLEPLCYRTCSASYGIAVAHHNACRSRKARRCTERRSDCKKAVIEATANPGDVVIDLGCRFALGVLGQVGGRSAADGVQV